MVCPSLRTVNCMYGGKTAMTQNVDMSMSFSLTLDLDISISVSHMDSAIESIVSTNTGCMVFIIS